VDDTIRASVNEEYPPDGSGLSRWYSEYLGYSYRSAVEIALAQLESDRVTILKTDLWNESLGGARDIAGHFGEQRDCRFVGVDLAYQICLLARSRVAHLQVVEADIRALPFRSGAFDAVLDLSTLDHLPASGAARALDEYGRVLRNRGMLLLVFWQRNVLMRLRLFVKRLLGRGEKPSQHYLPRDAVRARLGDRFGVVREFVTGSLLVPPHRLTSALLRSLPAATSARFVRWVVRTERSGVVHALLRHLAGLYGIAALRQRGEREAAACPTTAQTAPASAESGAAIDGAAVSLMRVRRLEHTEEA